MKQIRIAANFKQLKHLDLKVRAARVLNMLYSEPFFSDPPVPREELAAAYNRYSDSLIDVMDGARSKRVARDSARDVLIGCLVRLVPYVQVKSQGDAATMMSSGFDVKIPATVKGPVFLLPPKIRKTLRGGSGVIILFIKAIAEASSYKVRYAIIGDDGVPGIWTEFPVTKVKQAITVNGLTPLKRYVFQAQALGDLGFSDWSQSVPIST
ncbi:MAG TPA: fibronectin type III domain-containing protein [Terriglobia bacterium]|jgi:hypothetical protein